MNKQNLIYGLILLILCFLLYYSTIDTFFTGEDFDNIGYQSLNTVIRNFIFKPDMNTGHFTRGITNTFWAIQYQLFGKNHIPYHIVNILLYWICSFLVFKLALNLLDQHEDKRLISYIAGILFAVLPVHAIVVNWLTLLFEKFCIIFFISAFLFWIRFKESKKRLYYILTLIFFIFSMLSKEEAITLPIIIFIYDKIYFWKKERSWRNIFDSWMIYIPFLAISLAYFPYRIYRFSGL
ncbi:glycosyltransferase family 39 protein, partial [bacterium]|nr:glycosyltransferase family 39 protein [bacterium]